MLETAQRGPGVEPIEVVIVGSGYCGVELAATVAERLGNRGHVKVVDTAPDIVPSAPAGNREAALKVFLLQRWFVSMLDPEIHTFRVSHN